MKNAFHAYMFCFIYKSAWEMVEFDEWTGKSSRWNPENWTQPVCQNRFVKEMISRMDDKRSKVFNALQGTFGSQRLNVVPCKNLVLKLDDQQHRISIGLRLGANICVAHTCHCGKTIERDGSHGLSCTKNAGRFSRLGKICWKTLCRNPICRTWRTICRIFSAICPFEFAEFCRDNLPNT